MNGPFVWITASFILGILAHEKFRVPVEWVCVFTVALLLFSFVARRNNNLFAIFVLFSFVLLGWLCSHGHWLFPPDHVYFQQKFIPDRVATARGVIVSPVRATQIFSSTRLSFEFDLHEIKVRDTWQKCSGKVLVNLFQDVGIAYGDQLVMTGKLHRPFEFPGDSKFSYTEHLRRQGIYFVLSVKKRAPVKIVKRDPGNRILAKLYQWRAAGSRMFIEHLDASQASLMQAMLLGERSRIPADLKDIFARTGTAHILAISGLNVGILVAVVYYLLRFIPGPRRAAYCATVIFIFGYALLTGASASVVRAGIMSIVLLTSFVIERESDPVNSLAFAAFLLLVLDPNNLFGIGFQLSFLSVLAILLFFPLFLDLSRPVLKKYPSWAVKFLIESIALTVAASLGVGGLIAYYFGTVSLISPVTNLIAVPLSSAVTVLGMGMLAAGAFCPPLAAVPAFCVSVILTIMTKAMGFFSQWPYAYFIFQDVTVWQTAGYYLFLTSFLIVLDEAVLRLKFRRENTGLH